jgi:hypothetical protein
MIQVTGTYHRTFRFPADLNTSFHYFRDIPHILGLIPHITLLQSSPAQHYRMLYHTTELGLYQVKIYCDLRAEVDEQTRTLRIHSQQNGFAPVKTGVSMYGLTGLGEYSSLSTFREAGEQTEIDYQLRLHFGVPAPLALRLLPRGALESLASSITNQRIVEIAEGFIRRSIQDFEEARA